MFRLALVPALVCLFTASAFSQLTIPSDGSDGPFTPSKSIEVDLSAAITGVWSTPGTSDGVYDPDQWAVVFKFTEVNIPSGVTVTFKNHPKRPPVIWLVEGDVTINGAIRLNGEGNDASGRTSEPGPGGFRGGRSYLAGESGSAGFGPGGANFVANSAHASASYSETGYTPQEVSVPGRIYGNEGIFPLIGGSGGAGNNTRGCCGGNYSGGGAGGGAILIATAQRVILNGTISSRGGASGSYTNGGSGSGGAIRIVADIVEGSGQIDVSGGSNGGSASPGRFRVEANTNNLTRAFVSSYGLPGENPRIFRTPSDGTPTILGVSVNGIAVPDDPQSYPSVDVGLTDVEGLETVPLEIEAQYVPEGSDVVARVVRLIGQEDILTATYDGPGGGPDTSRWLADLPVEGGFATVQVHALLP